MTRKQTDFNAYQNPLESDGIASLSILSEN